MIDNSTRERNRPPADFIITTPQAREMVNTAYARLGPDPAATLREILAALQAARKTAHVEIGGTA
jgi:hypothetical protein